MARAKESDTEVEAPSTSEDPRDRENDLTPPKSERKKLLFQVDINLDNRVVRIGIHEGDDIDETVTRFGKLFNLKPKQERLLKKRLRK